ncbi:MAG TPA: DUF4126 domain-containing protein [Verrucomicrobiales bacterium]|nr:DUF4126 domain-containing protein [Verrucomicrobiales bacterium]
MPVPLSLLSLALAVACLSGVNLYLTAFLAGLAGRIGWLPVTGDLEVIGWLGRTDAMTLAAVLYLLEAIMDKIPAVDSLWDALHTVVRPAGAVLFILSLLSHTEPFWSVAGAVLAGVLALTFHLAKSALRLRINNTPGPLANILVSIGEDLLVAGLFALAVTQPLPALWVFAALVLLLWILFPRLFRSARASLFLIWEKLRIPAGLMTSRAKLSGKISAEQDILLHSVLTGPCTVEWSAQCLSGRARRFAALKPNLFGHLISVKEYPGSLVFLGRRWFRLRPAVIPLAGFESQHESGFLSENVVIYNTAEKKQIVFRFTRAEEALAVLLEGELHGQRKRAEPPVEDLELPAFAGIMEKPNVTEDVFLPQFMQDAPFHEAGGPAPVLPEAPSRPAPISPFPASTEEPPGIPPMPSLTNLPAVADVPPMPPTGVKSES